MRPVGKHVWVPIDIEMVEGPPDPHGLIICVQVDQRIAKNGCRTGVAMFCGDSGQVVTSRCRPPIHGNGSITNTIQIYCRRQGPRRKLRCMTTETPGPTVVDNLAARIATAVV